jgi:hypothetical protein
MSESLLISNVSFSSGAFGVLVRCAPVPVGSVPATASGAGNQTFSTFQRGLRSCLELWKAKNLNDPLACTDLGFIRRQYSRFQFFSCLVAARV